jgi:hypothetical protein
MRLDNTDLKPLVTLSIYGLEILKGFPDKKLFSDSPEDTSSTL